MVGINDNYLSENTDIKVFKYHTAHMQNKFFLICTVDNGCFENTNGMQALH